MLSFRDDSEKRYFSQVAFNIFQQAVGEAPKVAAPKPRAVGKATGDAKRMADMTPEQRKELALKAASARWNKSAPIPKGSGAREG